MISGKNEKFRILNDNGKEGNWLRIKNLKPIQIAQKSENFFYRTCSVGLIWRFSQLSRMVSGEKRKILNSD